MILSACSSGPSKSGSEAAARDQSREASPIISSPKVFPTAKNENQAGSSSIDSVALQSSLGMDRPQNRLGFQEKTFDTCQVGYGFSSTHDCQRKYFVVIHFQLMCRDSEGTTSEIITSDNLQPLSERPVNWSIKNRTGMLTGQTQTDTEGFGQIKAITAQSPSQQRLKLTLGNDFLYLKAGEVNRVVTPLSWCSQQTARR